MWKKVFGGVLGGFLVLRWTGRLIRTSRLGLARGPGAHLVLSPWLLAGYLAISASLLVAFAKLDRRGAVRVALIFVAVQIAGAAVAFQLS